MKSGQYCSEWTPSQVCWWGQQTRSL